MTACEGFALFHLGLHGVFVRVEVLALVGFGLFGEGIIVHHHVVRALDDARVSGNLPKKTRLSEALKKKHVSDGV